MRWLLLCISVLVLLQLPACALFELTPLDEYVSRYNYNMDKAPAILKTLLGNERVELDIDQNNGELFKVGFEMIDGQIVNTAKGGIENPTIQIKTREDVIMAMSQSPDPMTAFQKSKEAGDITIEGNNIVSNLKLDAALSSFDLLKYFYGILKGMPSYQE